MSSDKLRPFAGEKYLSLETYRKNGAAIATPVWFAEDEGVFYIYSLANAGKVKRIRNNPSVRVVPCDIRGNIKGEWVGGQSRIVQDDEEAKGHRLLDKKYGVLKKTGNLISSLMNRERVVIAIELD